MLKILCKNSFFSFLHFLKKQTYKKTIKYKGLST